MEHTLHWKLMCSKFNPPISGGAPSNVGPNTIERLEIDIEFFDSCSRILMISEGLPLISVNAIPVQVAHEELESSVIRIR